MLRYTDAYYLIANHMTTRQALAQQTSKHRYYDIYSNVENGTGL